MKKVLAFLFLICLMIYFSACDSSADELEQLKIEYSKYDQYEELVDALIIEDYDRVDDLIEGYKGQSVNSDLKNGTIKEIIIDEHNWSEYFVVEEITEWTENDIGEATGFITHVCIVMKDEYAKRYDSSRTNISFKWQAMCSVKNCDVVLDNRLVAFENVFKSNSTTFGDPELLSGTVDFDGEFEKNDYSENKSVASEIGEIVIVGEYSLNGQMKPVCFDFEDTTIIDSDGILTVYMNEE